MKRFYKSENRVIASSLISIIFKSGQGPESLIGIKSCCRKTYASRGDASYGFECLFNHSSIIGKYCGNANDISLSSSLENHFILVCSFEQLTGFPW